jgi:hypothetical protein
MHMDNSILATVRKFRAFISRANFLYVIEMYNSLLSYVTFKISLCLVCH